jgi:lipoate-protein ligase A
VLNAEHSPELQSITGANCTIMQRNRDAAAKVLGQPVSIRGTTDLALGDLKFSGNSQRRKRRSLLFHGTFLLDCDLNLIQECLRRPSKEPEYRRRREHKEFLTNLRVSPAALKAGLAKAWQAAEGLKMDPRMDVGRLVQEKYSREEWNLKW